MTQTKRMKAILISLVVFAVILATALFSVSFAMWDTGDGNGVEVVTGQSSLFYVEYPQYVTSDGVAVPVLEDNKHYLQVPRRDSDGNITNVSDYYLMPEQEASGGGTEKVVKYVRLRAGDTFNMFYGSGKIAIKGDDGSTKDDYITWESVGENEIQYTILKDGYFSFYFKHTYAQDKMYVGYTPASSGSTGNTGGSSTATPKRDTTKKSVKIKFTDTTVVFNMASNINGGETYFYIWKADVAGQRTEWPGLHMSTGADVACTAATASQGNTVELGFKSNEVAGILLNNNSNTDTVKYQTGDGSDFYDGLFGSLKANYTYTISTSKTHWNDFTNGDNISKQTLQGMFSVSEKAPGSSSGGTTTTITPAKPTTTGATSFEGSQKKNEEVVTVRKMDAAMNKISDDEYEYHNYICVSRQNADDSADDNSIAILEFEIEGNGATPNLSGIPVSSITLTRRDTDEEGNPVDGYISPAPRVYNYDLTNPVYLSEIGHGDLHESFDDVKGKNTENMIAHYDNGMYVILYFADKKQQYFALDLTIKTTAYAEFTLTASVNNTNMWDRYKEGFGEEWGYYMGGLINEVWLWNPTRTTKFEATSGTIDYVMEDEIEGLGLADEAAFKGWKDLDSATRAAKINAFNANKNFHYNIVDYSSSDGNDKDGYPMFARYTQDEVDITLTINLVAGSKIKLCMLDWSGERGDIGKGIMRPTTYYLPNNIHAFPSNLFASADNYDKDLNFVVPKTGEYSFRFYGHVHNYVGYWMKKSNGELYRDSDGNLSNPDELPGSIANQYVRIPQYNFVIDHLYISQSDEVGKMNTVTFDLKGGSFKEGAEEVTEQKVRFGNIVDWSEGKAPQIGTKPPQVDNIIPPTDKQFAYWYYFDAANNKVVYDEGEPVLKDMTLYIEWVGMQYDVTFDANEPDGKTATWTGDDSLTTDNAGTLAGQTLPTVAIDGYAFDGWYLSDGTTEVDTMTTTFTVGTTVYAKWTKLFTVTFHYNYDGAPNGGVYTTTPNARNGETISAPTAPTRTGYTFSKWYKDAARTTEWKFDTDTVSATAKDLYADWTIKNFTVSFEIDGVAGTGAYAVQTVQEGQKATEPATEPTKDYYTFDGWYNGATEWNFGTDAVMDNVTLAAKYTAITYTVKYDNLNGGTTTNPTSITIASFGEGTTIALSNPTPPAGKTFKQWLYGGEKAEAIKLEMLDKTEANTITFTAEYDTARYTVTIDTSKTTIPDGVTVTTSYQVDHGDKLVLEVEGLDEYSHVDLYTNTGLTYKYDMDSAVTSGKPLYAKYWRDDAVYVGGVYAKALTGKNNNTEYEARGVRVDAEQVKVEVWYGESKIAGTTDVKNNYYRAFYNGDGLKRGVYDFYYKPGTDDHGLWIEGYYIITFDANTGTLTGDAEVLTNKASTTTGSATLSTLSTDPTKAKHSFGGWYTAASGGSKVTASSNNTFSASATLYAHWTQNQFDVTFDYNDGTGTTTVLTTGTNGKLTSLPSSPTKAKHQFDGWYNTDGNEVTLTSNNSFSSDTTLTAHWTQNQFDVTFDYNDGTGTTTVLTTGTNGKLASLPSNPTRTGYRFDGWYTSDGKKVTLTSNNSFSSDGVTLTAKWVQQVTVTFNGNNGTWTGGVATQTQSVDKGGKASSIGAPENAPTGMSFDDWYEENATKAFDFDTEINSDITLYAHWTANFTGYTIALNANGGTLTGVNSLKTDADGKLTAAQINSATANLADCVFDGWWTSASGGARITEGYTFSSGITIYAHWNVTVTFDLNYTGATGAPASQTLERNVDTLELTEPSRTDYDFDGWYLSNGTKVTDSTTFDSHTTVYAQWKATVTFDVKDGTAASGATYSFTEIVGTTITVPTDPTPNSDLYEFDGWYLGDTQLTAGSITVTAKATYEAHYKAVKYRVILDVSSWPGYNHSTAYTYHIHAWGTSAVTGADTPEGEDAFDYRDEMDSMGGNKYYIELTKGVSHVIFTQDRNGTCNELSRYRVDASLELGNEYTYAPTISGVTINGNNQIGLQFNDGIVVLDASLWPTNDRPNQIYMWLSSNSPITAGWTTGQAGDNITFGKFTKYNASISAVYGIILAQNGNGWTGDINPGKSGSSFAKLVNGNAYYIKYQLFIEKYGDVSTVATAKSIGSSGKWLVGDGLKNGGWGNGVQVNTSDTKPVVIYVNDHSKYLKVRNGSGDSYGNTDAAGSEVSISGNNIWVSKNGYYSIIWNNNKVNFSFIRA